mgnify:CR=1 FL=1
MAGNGLIKQGNRDGEYRLNIGQGWPEKSGLRRHIQDVAGRKTLEKVSAGADRKTYQNLLLDAAEKAVQKRRRLRKTRTKLGELLRRGGKGGTPDRIPALPESKAGPNPAPSTSA